MSADYTYRRKLRATEMLPALAAGVGLGLAALYVAKLLLQRTPLVLRSKQTRALVRERPPQPPQPPRPPLPPLPPETG